VMFAVAADRPRVAA